jgi:hypothetical protein
MVTARSSVDRAREPTKKRGQLVALPGGKPRKQPGRAKAVQTDGLSNVYFAGQMEVGSFHAFWRETAP